MTFPRNVECKTLKLASPYADKELMRNKTWIYLYTLGMLMVLCGCVGYSPPHFLQMKPYTLIKSGDQLGRDQLANRWLTAQKLVPLKGKDTREVLTFLGQPSQVEVVQHEVSEDWYYIYYKKYKTQPLTEQGSFVVRIYNDKVLDVVNVK